MNDLDDSLQRKTVRATVATRVTIVGALILAAIIVTLQLQATFSTNKVARGIADQQKTNTSNVATIKAIARQIESCTTPGEPCSERGQRQTAKAVGDINRVVILAAACSVGLDQSLSVTQRQDRIQSCVIDRLATADPQP